MCSAGKTTCTIGFDGVLKPCNRVDMPYGNISNSLRDSWLKMGDWRTDRWVPKVCMACRLKSVCGGGCKANAIRAFGDIAMQDPLYSPALAPQARMEIKRESTNQASEFNVNPSLIQRYEEFGSILFLLLGRWIAVNHELTNLFLQRKEVVTRSDIARALSVDDDSVRATINVLTQRGILTELVQKKRR